MKYAIEQRLRFIDFLLGQYGYINRSALEDYFGITIQQASSDIKQYLGHAIGVKYNRNTKRYETSGKFERMFK
jgi:hypothetical protein